MSTVLILIVYQKNAKAMHATSSLEYNKHAKREAYVYNVFT
jgi:hypothetical protein